MCWRCLSLAPPKAFRYRGRAESGCRRRKVVAKSSGRPRRAVIRLAEALLSPVTVIGRRSRVARLSTRQSCGFGSRNGSSEREWKIAVPPVSVILPLSAWRRRPSPVAPRCRRGVGQVNRYRCCGTSWGKITTRAGFGQRCDVVPSSCHPPARRPSALLRGAAEAASGGASASPSPREFRGDGLAGAPDSYLVDPASSHMLVSKIKPCMSKYKHFIL